MRGKPQGCGSGSESAWIRIHFPSWIRIWIRIQYADPDPGGEIFQIKTEKNARKLLIAASLFNFSSNLHKAPLFLTFEQSFMFLTTIENSAWVYFLQILLSWIRIRIS